MLAVRSRRPVAIRRNLRFFVSFLSLINFLLSTEVDTKTDLTCDTRIGTCAKCAYAIIVSSPEFSPADKIVAYNGTRAYNTLVDFCAAIGLANITAYENTAPPNGTTAVAFVAQKTSGGLIMRAGDHWRIVLGSGVVRIMAVGSIW